MIAALAGTGVAFLAALGVIVYIAKLLNSARKDQKATSEKLVASERANADLVKERDAFILERDQYRDAAAILTKEVLREKDIRAAAEKHRNQLVQAIADGADAHDLARHINDELRALGPEDQTPPQGTRGGSGGGSVR